MSCIIDSICEAGAKPFMSADQESGEMFAMAALASLLLNASQVLRSNASSLACSAASPFMALLLVDDFVSEDLVSEDLVSEDLASEDLASELIDPESPARAMNALHATKANTTAATDQNLFMRRILLLASAGGNVPNGSETPLQNPSQAMAPFACGNDFTRALQLARPQHAGDRDPAVGRAKPQKVSSGAERTPVV